MLAALLLVTATFRPPNPTVGDPITIDFAKPVTIAKSPNYEIVSQKGSRVVVRTFQPRPFALSGTTDGVFFRNLVVPVRSVLAQNDNMKPAPLKPPHGEPWPRAPFLAIGAAALAAAIAWALVYATHRRDLRARKPVEVVPPADRFRRSVETLILNPQTPQRWAALADCVRRYLDARGFGADLTTSQLLQRLHRHEIIADILRRGDLEKFSQWGPPPGDFAAIASRALELPEQFEPKPAEEAA